MSRFVIVEGNNNDKDNVRAIMVKGEKGDMGDLNHNDIIDNVTSTATDKVLSAKQGKVLKDLIDNNKIDTDQKPYYFDSVSEMKEYDLKVGDMVITTGYYNANDGGGSQYIIVEEESETEYQEELENGLYATLIIDNDVVYPEQFGAKGNGVTDDTIPFQNALDSNKVVKAYNSYLLTDLAINDGNDIEFSPNTIIYRNKTDIVNEAGLFVASGKINDTIYTLSSDTSINNSELSINTTSDLAIGDTIIIKNPAISGADSNKMLVTTIVDIDNNQITIGNPLQWDYPTNSTIQKIEPIHFKINGNGAEFNNMGLVGRGYFVYVNYGNDFIVENINVNNSACGVARIYFSINGSVRNCIGKNPTSLDAPYGEFLSMLYSTNINADNITCYKYRRCIDYIGSTYCNTYNSHGFDSGFTTHGNLARYCSFINCRHQQLLGSSIRSNVIGNLDYYYDKDIKFENCSFMNGNRNIYVVNDDCTCIIKNCRFINSDTCIYNSGSEVNIEGCEFNNVITLISNQNTTYDNIVRISNTNCITRGSSSRSVITSSSNLKTINYISNSNFKGTNRILENIMIIDNCSFDFDINAALCLQSGSRMYNSKLSRNFDGRDNNKIFNCVFGSYNHTDEDNAQNVIIQGCLYSGSIDVTSDSQKGNYISDNIQVENIR